MICYLDRTFCSFYEKCSHGKGCPRALTEEVREKARAWWSNENEEPPIAVYMDKPECFEEKE